MFRAREPLELRFTAVFFSIRRISLRRVKYGAVSLSSPCLRGNLSNYIPHLSSPLHWRVLYFCRALRERALPSARARRTTCRASERDRLVYGREFMRSNVKTRVPVKM